MSFEILGTGRHLPARVLTNQELSTMVDTSDEWIARRVGVRERRVCTTETAAELAYRAALNALEMSGTRPEELDLILCATVSPDDASPSMACAVQAMLGATCPAMDINAACSAFIYLLETAAAFLALGKVKKVLIIAAERLSRMVDWSDRNTCVIFGDGAGALVLGRGESLLASKLFARGGDNVIKIPHFAGKSPFYQRESASPYIYMNGQETFKFAVGAMCQDLTEVIDRAGLRQEEISWVLPHQANLRILEAAAKRLSIPADRFCSNIDRCGNTSAASIPILLDEMNRAGKLSRGDYLALCAFGGGLSSGACVIRWNSDRQLP